ncbi:glycoside hydrolase [Lobosporangium transversale]|uniref:alpha-1,2-Mannosidase n=1 Tax=Lobosporangium transversale TaxID=64571 RepID=A0A1Y2GBW9_9FUNG|nr:glycoside hydrolase [Lobosporangium transversale]ORZ04728.1 glycoside hydrolase [Lobosporangium transversale]|eukprot:XP_021876725.1 glycoside hydrolase [Lobosporangium transversale]
MFMRSSSSASWTGKPSVVGQNKFAAAGPPKDQVKDKITVPPAAHAPAPTVGVVPAPEPAQPQKNQETKQPQEKEKKKRKKKVPPTLFEFDDPDLIVKAKPQPKSNSPKKQQQQSNPSAPSPVPVVPVVPARPKPQHNWKEGEDVEETQVEVDFDSNLSGSDDDDHDRMDHLDDDVVLDTTGSDLLLESEKVQKQVPIDGGNDIGGGTDSGHPKANSPLWEARKNKVKEAFLHSWNAYRRDAWGKDEYHPISKYGSNMIRKGQGFTIVDSLDTILLMGLDSEFQEAKAWVQDELDFDQDGEVNLFETTIRVLGGLLSAYNQSSHDDVFLDKAVDLADRLMGAFETTSGIPYASVHLRDRRGVPSHDRGISSTSEVATLQLEFKYLSYLTGDEKYWKAVENVELKIKEQESLDGLVPIYINPYTGHFQGGEIRLGSRGDSYYEYLIKQYLQTGKQEHLYKEMYDHAIAGVKKHLLGRTIPNNLLFVGEISKYEPANLSPKMDHLVCFLGGTMALASTEGHPLDNSGAFARSKFTKLQEDDFKIGEDLTESCYKMYRQTETGLAPEIVYWVQREEQIRGKTELQHRPGSDFIINDRDGHNWLRPETVESLFYLWRLTGDEKYRQWGWNIFESIEKYSKVSSGGYSSIHDIRRADNIVFSDKMETFFLAETLKYFYLLFGSNDVLPLEKYVFNTEAHPLPVFTPPKEWITRTTGGVSSGPSTSSTAPSADNSISNSNSNDKISNDQKGNEELNDQEKRYKDLIDQQDGLENAEDMDDDEESRDEKVKAGDDDTGVDGNLSPPEHYDGDETEIERDEIDQGLESLPVDENSEGEVSEDDVPEVEVDFEENGEDDQDENEEEEEEEDIDAPLGAEGEEDDDDESVEYIQNGGASEDNDHDLL